MHSFLRYSFSNTFSTMTTLPSATDVTRRASSANGVVRLGTRKNHVMNTMKTIMARQIGRLIQMMGMKRAARKMSTAQIHQLVKMVP